MARPWLLPTQNADVLKMRAEAADAVMIGSELLTAPTGCRIRQQVAGTPWADIRVRIAMRRAVDWDNKDVGASPTYTPAYYERHQVIMREYERTLGGGVFKPHMNLVPYREFADQIIIKWPMKGFTIAWNNSGDVDNVAYRLWHSSNNPAFPDAKLDELAKKQRHISDPVARAGVLKDLSKYLAEFFPSIPTQGSSSTFTFEWPWLHNSYPYPNINNPFINGHKQWLDPATPKRNG